MESKPVTKVITKYAGGNKKYNDLNPFTIFEI